MVGPLAYIGGKNRLAAKIISLLPEHTTYVSPKLCTELHTISVPRPGPTRLMLAVVE